VFFAKAAGRARALLAISVLALITGGALLTICHGDPGSAPTVDALLTSGAIATIGGGEVLLHQWHPTRRALATSSWRPARGRLSMTPGGRGLYDLLFADGQLALAQNSASTGNLNRAASPHTTGHATLPDPVDALGAGDPANPSVLASRNGAVLLPSTDPAPHRGCSSQVERSSTVGCRARVSARSAW